MASIELDITDPASIAAVASQLTRDFPQLNVLVNNAGIMQIDDVSAPVDDALLLSTVTTNLLGPIRLTGALVEHLKTQPDATIINVSSVLGFVPLAVSAVYSSTKAAIHSYTESLRWRLKGTSVKVREIAPPWVQTDLLNSNEEPRAMPLAPFIAEPMQVLASDANEVLVDNAKPLRAAGCGRVQRSPLRYRSRRASRMASADEGSRAASSGLCACASGGGGAELSLRATADPLARCGMIGEGSGAIRAGGRGAAPWRLRMRSAT